MVALTGKYASDSPSTKLLEKADTVIDTSNCKSIQFSNKPVLLNSSSMEVDVTRPTDGIKINRSGSETLNLSPVYNDDQAGNFEKYVSPVKIRGA